jgi:hypothetical protein
MREPHDIEARGVKDERDNALLFDLWVDGVWVGSRRTVRQCEQQLSHLCGVEVEATPGRPW